MTRRKSSTRAATKVRPDKRGMIVSSALELFADHGLHDVTLKHVSERSGFNLGSIYHFFPEKKSLYNAAVQEAARRFGAEMSEALAEPGNAQDRLRAFCRRMLETIARNDRNFVLMDRARSEDRSEDFPGVMEGSAAGIYDALGSLFDELMGSEPNGPPTPWLASYVISLVYGAGQLHRNHVGLQKLTGEADEDRFLQGVVEFALSSLQSQAASRV